MSDFLDHVGETSTVPTEQRDAALNVLDELLERFGDIGRGYTTPQQQEVLRRARLLVMAVPRSERGYQDGDE